jgi:hypothetical protein
MQEAKEVEELMAAIRPLLAGKSAAVQGAVLADLLSLWLAGHVVADDPKATKRIRENLLELHLEAMWRLVEVNYRELIEPEITRRRSR